jgi:L-aspartate oxidase
MWEDAGLVRDEAGLTRAAGVLAAWSAEVRTPRTEWEFEDENLLLVAARLVNDALQRERSVGAHFRSDDPGASAAEGAASAAISPPVAAAVGAA